jgi:hypothetical protein
VKAGDWYYDDVKLAYQSGIAYDINGGFLPTLNLMTGEIAEIAARVRCIYNGDDLAVLERKNGQDGFDGYVDYCIQNGMEMKIGEGGYQGMATRSWTAHLLSQALPAEEYPVIRPEIVAVPYRNKNFPYYNDILLLFRSGILGGCDEYGNWGTMYITRAEAVAIANRLLYPERRKSETLKVYPMFLEEAEVQVGEMVQMQLVYDSANTLIPGYPFKTLWKSDDQSIATVNDDGQVYGILPGKAVISACDAKGNLISKAMVTILG